MDAHRHIPSLEIAKHLELSATTQSVLQRTIAEAASGLSANLAREFTASTVLRSIQSQQVQALKFSLPAALPPFESLRAAVEGMNSLARSAEAISAAINAVSFRAAEFERIGRVISELAAQRAAVFEFSRFSGVAELSLRMASAANALQVTGSLHGIRSILAADFTTVSRQFSSFLQNIRPYLAEESSLSRELLSIPSREFFVSEELLEVACEYPTVESDLEAEKENIRAEIDLHTASGLEKSLVLISPKLVEVWWGAKAAVESQNRDKARHALVSARELATQVLHALAPDDQVRKWNPSPDNYDEKGRPTRRARLFYACRTINCGPLKAFVEKDVSALLALFDVFQAGTHGIDPGFSEKQLRMIFRRAESALCSLIEIGDAGKA